MQDEALLALENRTLALVQPICAILRERGQDLSLAESCSGGLLSSLVTVQPGVSDVFVGSIVAYSNQVKSDWLDVPFSLLRSVGAVSLPVARSMALGVRKGMGTSWSLSITGIAGPDGGTPQKPVGTVCIGLSGPGVELVEQHLFRGGRRGIQAASAHRALELLLENLASVS